MNEHSEIYELAKLTNERLGLAEKQLDALFEMNKVLAHQVAMLQGGLLEVAEACGL